MYQIVLGKVSTLSAGLSIVWPQFLTLLAIGGVFFLIALLRFRKTIGTMA
ncbi:hypothetical protein HIN51_23895 [Salmonella enterica subsp. enterica serovar Dublin]|nr:hypothetical protein [Salmonella enterica subsp. enterica serovar Dublin]